MNGQTEQTGDELKVTMDREWQTRDGRAKATIYCVDAPGNYPVHGRIENTASPLQWLANGRFVCDRTESATDLVPVPRRIKRVTYMNVYNDGSPASHSTRGLADSLKSADRLACVPISIDVPEGYGLDGSDVKPLEVRA